MMEVARENARHELPTKVNLLYKVKFGGGIHLLPGVSIQSVT